MPSSTKRKRNSEVVPVIESNIFDNNSDRDFAICEYSADDILNYKQNSIEEAYLKLRANVYIDQTDNLSSESKRYDGTEIDEDDKRSEHFVVLENLMGKVAVFACMRVIRKQNYNHLPIEKYFPEDFKKIATNDSVEVSRFIVRNDRFREALTAEKNLIISGLAYVIDNNLGPIYGVVEPKFERSLKMINIPSNRVTEPGFIEYYNSENVGIEIEKEKLEKSLGTEAILSMNTFNNQIIYFDKKNRNNQNEK